MPENLIISTESVDEFESGWLPFRVWRSTPIFRQRSHLFVHVYHRGLDQLDNGRSSVIVAVDTRSPTGTDDWAIVSIWDSTPGAGEGVRTRLIAIRVTEWWRCRRRSRDISVDQVRGRRERRMGMLTTDELDAAERRRRWNCSTRFGAAQTLKHLHCGSPLHWMILIFFCHAAEQRLKMIEEFNVDSKAEYSTLSSTRSQKKKKQKLTNASAPSSHLMNSHTVWLCYRFTLRQMDSVPICHRFFVCLMSTNSNNSAIE